jgi:membrane associated rhomboid family serine protease
MRKAEVMRKSASIVILLAASMSVGACATHDRYGYNDRYDNNRGLARAATGAALGAAAGAAVGGVVDGVSVGQGAAVGAIAGGAIAAATDDQGRRWYRDRRGYCYYVERDGDVRYDYDRRC